MDNNFGSTLARQFPVPLGIEASTYGSIGNTCVAQYYVVGGERIIYLYVTDMQGGDIDGRLIAWNVDTGEFDFEFSGVTGFSRNHQYGPACGFAEAIDGQDWWYVAGGYNTTGGNEIERMCVSDKSIPSENTGDLIAPTVATQGSIGITYNGYLYRLGSAMAKYNFSTGVRTDLTLATGMGQDVGYILDQANNRVFYFDLSENLRYYDVSSETSTLVRASLPDYFSDGLGSQYAPVRGMMVGGDSFTFLPGSVTTPIAYSSLLIDLDTDNSNNHFGWFLDEIDPTFVGLSEPAICKHSNGLYYIFGGKTSTETNGTDDIWEFDPATETLTKYAAKLPEDLHSGTLVEDTDTGHLYYFGGNGSVTSELHCLQYNVTTHTITAKANMPSGSEFPGVIYNSSEGKFGVMIGTNFYKFDGDANTWTSSLHTASYSLGTSGRENWCAVAEDYLIYVAGTTKVSIDFAGETSSVISGDIVDPDTTYAMFSKTGYNGAILFQPSGTHIYFTHQTTASKNKDNLSWPNPIEAIGNDTGVCYVPGLNRLVLMGGDLICSNMLVKYDIANDKFSIVKVGVIPFARDINNACVISMDGWAIIPWVYATLGAVDGSYTTRENMSYIVPYDFETFSGNVQDSSGVASIGTDIFALSPWLLKLMFGKTATDGSGDYVLKSGGDSTASAYSEKPTVVAIPETGQGTIRTNADINQGA